MIRNSNFAERLRQYRKNNNITLDELSAIVNEKPQTLNRYELEQRVPKIDTACRIAKLLNINPLWLQGYDVDIDTETQKSGSTEVKPLTEEEIKLVELYRMLPKEKQAQVYEYCALLSGNTSQAQLHTISGGIGEYVG